MQCVNNLKQIGLALANYESASRSFPPSFVADPNAVGSAYGISYPDGGHQHAAGLRLGDADPAVSGAGPALRELQHQPPVLGPGQHDGGPDEGGGVHLSLEPRGQRRVLAPPDTRTAMRATRTTGGLSPRRSDFAHSHYVTNAGVNQPWGRSTAVFVRLRRPRAGSRRSRRHHQRPVLSELAHDSGRRDRRAVQHGLHRRADLEACRQHVGRRRPLLQRLAQAGLGRPTRTAAATWSVATAARTSTTTPR